MGCSMDVLWDLIEILNCLGGHTDCIGIYDEWDNYRDFIMGQKWIATRRAPQMLRDGLSPHHTSSNYSYIFYDNRRYTFCR